MLRPCDGIGRENKADVGIIEQKWSLAQRHHLAGEGERLLAEGVGVADVGEDDLLALLLELGGPEVELAAHGVLHLLDVLVQLLVVQRLTPAAAHHLAVNPLPPPPLGGLDRWGVDA